MEKLIISVLLFTIVQTGFCQTSGITTYCNPVDINYQYQYIHQDEHLSYRSGADPVILNYKGEYYLFATNSNGWWHSKDLGHWKYVVPALWPKEHVNAPAVRVVDDTIFLYQSGRAPLFYTTDPENGKLAYYNPMMPPVPGATGPVDPDIFYDNASNKWYMYFGSSNKFPIYGIELNHQHRLTYIGSPKELIYLHPDIHGWERFGQDHTGTITPFIEGAWMTKYRGKYYLQYAAPGTEYNVYANGTYIGDNPLGQFMYAPYNPISYKPGGFLTGAGHGNTFQDNYGNYWNTGTPWIAVNFNFERRIAMFPAGFDLDDQMFVNTRFGDFPHWLPHKKWHNKDELFTGWMLLSYKKPCNSSTALDSFPAINVTDENPRTFWVARQNKPGEWLTIDLQKICTIQAIQVNFTDYKSNIFHSGPGVYTQFQMYASVNGDDWQKIADLTPEKRDRPNAYIELPTAVKARYIKYEHVYVAAPNLAISDIRIFGNSDEKIPEIPENFMVQRDKDPRNALVSWRQVPGAVGYNILWGIAHDKLYETYQIFNDQENKKEIRSLSTGQDYYFAIEAFNEKGVSKQSKVLHIQ